MTSIINLSILSWNPTIFEVAEYISLYKEEMGNLIISVIFPIRNDTLPYSYVKFKEILDARFNVKFRTATMSYYSDQCFFYIDSPSKRIIIQSIKKLCEIDKDISLDKIAETLDLRYISGEFQ